MKRIAQKDKIIKILEQDGEISNVKCFNGDYGFTCLRLGDIIFRLRRLGWEFHTDMQGKNKNQAVYKLLKDPRKVSLYKVDGVVVGREVNY